LNGHYGPRIHLRCRGSVTWLTERKNRTAG
jgi:hypothetical protein